MKKICLVPVLLTAIGLSACSFIGRQFDNHALDYLEYEPKPELPSGGLVEEPYSDSYPVIDELDSGNKPNKFLLAKPQPLNLNEAQNNQYISLSAYTRQTANPRLDYDGAGTLILKMDSAFDVSWSEVLKTFDIDNFKLIDFNRNTGVYYVESLQLADRANSNWWQRLFNSQPMVMQTFLLKMDSISSGVFLSLLTDGDTLAKPEVTQALLTAIRDKLR